MSCGFTIIRGSVGKGAQKPGSEECQRACFVVLDIYFEMVSTLQPYVDLCSLCVFVVTMLSH